METTFAPYNNVDDDDDDDGSFLGEFSVLACSDTFARTPLGVRQYMINFQARIVGHDLLQPLMCPKPVVRQPLMKVRL